MTTASRALTERLLSWYDRDGRTLPWRSRSGESVDPYRVWLSEVMLQQTTVAAVIPYYQTFTTRWPTVTALAQAPLDEVLAAWAGLGYYARARNLHRCARLLADWRGGHFPEDEQGLRALPGIGDYTAAAIAAIAFGQVAVVVDGNVERVMARLFAETDPLPAVKPRLKARAAELTPARRPGDYAQAVMDLGATLCTPRNPACGVCPWRDDCAGRKQGIAATLPARLAKPERPTRHGMAFWVTDRDGAVLLRRRPPTGLLGGMMEIPSTDWRSGPWTLDEAIAEAPVAADRLTGVRLLPGRVRHVFTHFHLDLAVVAARAPGNPAARGLWCTLDQLDGQGLPTLMRKVVHLALSKAY